MHCRSRFCLVLLAFFSVVVTPLSAQPNVPSLPVEPKPGVLAAIAEDFPGGGLDGYLLYLPRSFAEDPTRQWPVIMFLQGGLAVGGELPVIANWGIPKLLHEGAAEEGELHSLLFDEIIFVAPHLTAEGRQGHSFYRNAPAIESIFDHLIENYRADPDRISLTGLSRGGHGTWGLASRLGHRLSAAAPIGGNTSGITSHTALAKLPLWILHNSRDRVVSAEGAMRAAAWIEQISGESFLWLDSFDPNGSGFMDAKRVFTAVDSESHDAWRPTYSRVEFYRWMLQHRREPLPIPERQKMKL